MSVIRIWIIVILLSVSFGAALMTLPNPTLIYSQPPETHTNLVHAGIGNDTDIVFAFIPQNMAIKTG